MGPSVSIQAPELLPDAPVRGRQCRQQGMALSPTEGLTL